MSAVSWTLKLGGSTSLDELSRLAKESESEETRRYSIQKTPSLERSTAFREESCGCMALLKRLTCCYYYFEEGCDIGNQFYRPAIGRTLAAAGYGAEHLFGGAFRPPVALGLDVASAFLGVFWGAVYCVYEVIGARLDLCVRCGVWRQLLPRRVSHSRSVEKLD